MTLVFIAALCGQQCRPVVVQRQTYAATNYNHGYANYAHNDYYAPVLTYQVKDTSDIELALKATLETNKSLELVVAEQRRLLDDQKTADEPDAPEPADPAPAPAKAKAAPKKARKLTPEQLIVKHCGACHNANAPNASSFRIGSTWSRVAKAAVYAAVTDKDAGTAMPKGKTMPDADRAAIIQWATPCEEPQKAGAKK